MINKEVMGEETLIDVLVICQKGKFYGTLKLLLTQDHMGAGNFKTLLLLQFSSNLSQTS